MNRLRHSLAVVLLRTAHRVASHHIYLSTSCLHHDHDYCQHHTGLSGAKRPSVCKFCKAPCICVCHRGSDE
ncbi:hypothetical protein ABZ419_11355 [Streptomyces cinnamoneus]|uniref:hypothetical protein n=1 Tax=Streptomyces cinnamoneus TaxID=53446 RepID=UPI003408DCB6